MTASRAAAEAAVRHILDSPCLVERSRPTLGGAEVDWPALLAEAETMSNGQRLLVRVAHDLWEAAGGVGIRELARGLDATHFERVMTALWLYRGDVHDASLAALREVA